MTIPLAIIVDASTPNKGPATAAPVRSADELIRSWQPGQMLQAQAETDSDATGRLLLRIGGLSLAALAPLPVKQGQRFQLEVLALEQIPLLKVLNKAMAPSRLDLTPYLRRTLPRQSDPARLLQQLVSLAKSSSPLAPRLMERIHSLTDSLPEAGRLRSPGQLKGALQNSGQFLEKTLKTATGTTAATASDFKARLLRLDSELQKQLASTKLPTQTAKAGALRPSTVPTSTEQLLDLFKENRLTLPQLAGALTRHLTPEQLTQLQKALADYRGPSRHQTTAITDPALQVIQAIRQKTAPSRSAAALLQLLRTLPLLQDLQQQTDGALARLQSNQLLMANRDSGNFLLLLDLPLRHQDDVNTVQLQLERERKTDPDQEEAWRVSLHFNLPALGPLQVKVRLQGQRLSTRFHTGHAATERGLRQQLPRLQESLGALGLHVEMPAVELELELAQQPAPQPFKARRGILDETA
ncbi:MAG: flagellar hook-length control protein FliK [Gammaproteobacteria bacterium]